MEKRIENGILKTLMSMEKERKIKVDRVDRGKEGLERIFTSDNNENPVCPGCGKRHPVPSSFILIPRTPIRPPDLRRTSFITALPILRFDQQDKNKERLLEIARELQELGKELREMGK